MDELIDCARYGELDEVQQILSQERTASADAADFVSRASGLKDENGNTALHMAAANGHVDIVVELLKVWPAPAVDAVNFGGNTALHWAALNGHLPVVQRLLDAGADPELKNSAGKSALFEAMTSDKADVADLLLKVVEEKARKSGALGDDDDDGDDDEDNDNNGDEGEQSGDLPDSGDMLDAEPSQEQIAAAGLDEDEEDGSGNASSSPSSRGKKKSATGSKAKKGGKKGKAPKSDAPEK